MLKTADGVQHLLLRGRRRRSQVLCRGADIRTDPFALELVIDEFPHVERCQRLISRLSELCSNRHTRGAGRVWTVEAMRHRDALAALDLRLAGRTYREIAVFLHGREAVEKDWTDPGRTMKNRVIRSTKRGLTLMNGGYRKLLV